jgi:hypothetical protein
MNISTACRTIRAWSDLLDPDTTRRGVPGGLPEAVAALRLYLEAERGDGQPIAELVLPQGFLVNRESLLKVMAFVMQAEAIVASRAPKRVNDDRIASLTALIGATGRRCLDLERALAAMAALDADEAAADHDLRSAQHLLWLYKVHLARLQSRSGLRP